MKRIFTTLAAMLVLTASALAQQPAQPAQPTKPTEPATGEAVVKPTEPAAPQAAVANQPTEVTASTHFDVIDLVLSKEIVDRNAGPVLGTAAVGDKVYSWVKLAVKDPETTVRFRWIKDGTPVHTGGPLTVKESTGWRTWQYKTADAAGAWKVEVLDAEDHVVKVAELTVQ